MARVMVGTSGGTNAAFSMVDPGGPIQFCVRRNSPMRLRPPRTPCIRTACISFRSRLERGSSARRCRPCRMAAWWFRTSCTSGVAGRPGSASCSRMSTSEACVPSIWELKRASFRRYIATKRSGFGRTAEAPSRRPTARSAALSTVSSSGSRSSTPGRRGAGSKVRWPSFLPRKRPARLGLVLWTKRAPPSATIPTIQPPGRSHRLSGNFVDNVDDSIDATMDPVDAGPGGEA